jgi:uncharacterized protein
LTGESLFSPFININRTHKNTISFHTSKKQVGGICMALLGNPFVANIPRMMTGDELAQALRVDITGEMEAIIGYEAHAAATGDTRAKKVLFHIADEERRHVGELQQLLAILSPKDGDWVEKGKSAILQQQADNFQAPLS